MAVKWTEQQQQVIDLRNRSILVSAAAGSGKTAVLVERIIQMICDKNDPVDIDRLLVVTFTNAAASQMRERILAAIEKKLEEDPSDEHLKKQEILIGHAHIMTIHSFCLSVIREHFHEIKLDPSFRIGDEGELKLLQADVIEKLFEQEYEQGSEAFSNFCEAYASGKDDKNALDMVLRLYSFAMAAPRPLLWLDQCMDTYRITDAECFEKQKWLQDMLGYIRLLLQEQVKQCTKMIEICRLDDGPEIYEALIAGDRELIAQAASKDSYDDMRNAVRNIRFAVKPRKKKTDTFSEAKADQVSLMRDSVKKAVSGIASYFTDDLNTEMEKMRSAGSLAGELIRLTKSFSVQYSQAKRKKNLVDFSDLEHMALEILSTNDGTKEVPTAAALEYREYFKEVMVDEYQDSNYVQEILLLSVAKPDAVNLFMVGDVKQSIYRFRLARPELFMKKYDEYTDTESLHQKIELRSNFRSRKMVLDAVNFIFYQIMHKCVGNVEYNEAAALYAGNKFEETDKNIAEDTELLLLDTEDTLEAEDDDKISALPENEYNSHELEALMIAGRIKELTDPVNGTCVWDDAQKEYRIARYSDIAILLRAVDGWSDAFTDVLISQGIPASADTGSGYFSTVEVMTALSILEIIDNPHQDIPLMAVLRSPAAEFSDNDIARIKTQMLGREGVADLYDTIMSYIAEVQDELSARLAGFIRKLEEYRRLGGYTSIYKLLRYVLEDSGYYRYVCSMPGAAARRANLDMLLEKARAFEKTSYKGVFWFVRYINKLKKYQVDYASAQENTVQDQVRIMTIHKSKGLEFPICIVAGLGKAFNNRDLNGDTIYHADYGIGTDIIDHNKRVKGKTLLKQAIRLQYSNENMGEELRVLYVALTRAKEKLILTGAKSRLLEYLQSCLQNNDAMERDFSYGSVCSAKRMLDWVVKALAKHSCFREVYNALDINVPFNGPCFGDNTPFRVKLYTKSELKTADTVKKTEQLVQKTMLENWKTGVYDQTCADIISERFEADYAYDSLFKIQAAWSVSELKRAGTEEKEKSSGTVSYPVPEFVNNTGSVRGAQRGTVYHWLFEHFDFAKAAAGTESFEKQLKGFAEKALLSEEEVKAVKIKDFYVFAESWLGKEYCEAQKQNRLHRETPFILGVTAAEAFGADTQDEEYVSIQGVIDAWIEKDEGIVLIDYKTDYVREDNTQILKERYENQLIWYKKALEQMSGRKVISSVIYSVFLGEILTI